MKYINADKLKAAIERRRLSNRYIDTEDYENELLEIIDSLQQERQDVGLEEAAEYYYHKGVYEGLSQGRADALKMLEEFMKRKADPVIVIKQQEQQDVYQRGYEQAEQNIVSLIESRIAEILGDAQPAPVLRTELRELIERIKEESK